MSIYRFVAYIPVCTGTASLDVPYLRQTCGELSGLLPFYAAARYTILATSIFSGKMSISPARSLNHESFMGNIAETVQKSSYELHRNFVHTACEQPLSTSRRPAYRTRL